jgi:hypothetical protein
MVDSRKQYCIYESNFYHRNALHRLARYANQRRSTSPESRTPGFVLDNVVLRNAGHSAMVVNYFLCRDPLGFSAIHGQIKPAGREDE